MESYEQRWGEGRSEKDIVDWDRKLKMWGSLESQFEGAQVHRSDKEIGRVSFLLRSELLDPAKASFGDGSDAERLEISSDCLLKIQQFIYTREIFRVTLHLYPIGRCTIAALCRRDNRPLVATERSTARPRRSAVAD